LNVPWNRWLKKTDAVLDGGLTFFSFLATDLLPELQVRNFRE
jgi:hypothetical protein